MKDKLKRLEVWFKLLLVAFFCALYILAIPYPAKSKQFPQLIAVFSLLMLFFSLVSDFTKKDAKATQIGDVDGTELEDIDEAARNTRRKRFAKAWAILLFSAAAGFLGGFLFATFFLLLGFALFFGGIKDRFKNSAIAVILTIAIYFIFQYMMAVPLLNGVLW